jgi:rubrerythrin
METKFNVFEIFQIAEKIEHDGAKFYLRAAELFDDPERMDILYKLANWKAKHEKALAQRRKQFSEKTGQFGTFDPDDYVLSHPNVMASLAEFATKPSPHGRMTGHEEKRQIFESAIGRSKQVIAFYRGLKDFAKEPGSLATIEQIIEEENTHIRLLLEELKQQ